MVKEYGLENEKLAGNKRRKGMPLVLDDRLISKQYIKEKTDAKVDNTAFASSWNGVEDVAPSKDAVFDKINSFVNVSDVWTKKDDDASDSNVRANKTGKYSIGHANFTDDSTWEKLNLVGSFKINSGDIKTDDDFQIGPESGSDDARMTMHKSNGVKFASKVAIGATNPSVPLEVNLSGSVPTAADGTGIIQAGADGAANLGIGVDKLQARDGSAAAAELKLNTTGGSVSIGSSGATTTINGNLNVVGTATTTLSETVNIKDSEILLNSDLDSSTAPSVNAGIRVERGNATDAQLIWNESDDKWQVHNGTTTYDITHSTHAPVTLGTNTATALSLSGQELSLADKFLQIGGDTATGAMTFGSSGNQTDNSGSGTTMLTVFGGPSTGNAALVVNGHLKADTKSFDIPHPIKKNKRLVHGTLEGPEFGMYQRGTLKSNLTIEEIPLPAYWGKLVSDYTVSLTPHGNYNVWLVEKHKNMFEIKTNADALNGAWECEWIVIGRRNDYPLEVEQ
jgi:hypothetical protein